jgi:hypothetical protein
MNRITGAAARKSISLVRMVATKQNRNPPSNIADRTISKVKYFFSFSERGSLVSIFPTVDLKKK